MGAVDTATAHVMDRTQKAALLSAGIGLAVTALKFYAAWLTGSLALYSDALESIINVVAAVGRLRGPARCRTPGR